MLRQAQLLGEQREQLTPFDGRTIESVHATRLEKNQESAWRGAAVWAGAKSARLRVGGWLMKTRESQPGWVEAATLVGLGCGMVGRGAL